MRATKYFLLYCMIPQFVTIPSLSVCLFLNGLDVQTFVNIIKILEKFVQKDLLLRTTGIHEFSKFILTKRKKFIIQHEHDSLNYDLKKHSTYLYFLDIFYCVIKNNCFWKKIHIVTCKRTFTCSAIASRKFLLLFKLVYLLFGPLLKQVSITKRSTPEKWGGKLKKLTSKAIKIYFWSRGYSEVAMQHFWQFFKK